jgi:polar amino acid transport system permease protein
MNNAGFVQFLPPLLRGTELTLMLVGVSGVVGTILGLVFGMARIAPVPPLRWVAAVYINFLRGQPILIILLFIYFALPLLFPAATFNRGFTAIVGLSIYAGAYMAEIFRGSINAVPTGQTEAAKALGLSYGRRLRHVVLPQAMRIAVPPGIGFLIALIKDSSLVSVIGFVELTRSGTTISNLTAQPIITYLVVAVLYFVICYGVSKLGSWYENRSGSRTETAEAENQPQALQLEGV